MECLGVELTKGILESTASNSACQVACCSLVENRPKADRLTHGLSCHPAKDKRRGVLGFENERFEPPRGNNTEIRVGHVNPSTTFAWESKAELRFLGHRPQQCVRPNW